MEGVFVSTKLCTLHECNLQAGWAAAAVDVAIIITQKKLILQFWKP